MNPYFLKKLPPLEEHWSDIKHLFKHNEAPAKTILLYEGDVADKIYFIEKGALRLWNNDAGKDITMQFFFENQLVASFESLFKEKRSMFSIETIEPTVVMELKLVDFKESLAQYPELNTYITEFISERFINYMEFFLSRIKDSPEKRYYDLRDNQPEILERVPQHYIASYLGITSVSLSRIKNRNS